MNRTTRWLGLGWLLVACTEGPTKPPPAASPAPSLAASPAPSVAASTEAHATPSIVDAEPPASTDQYRVVKLADGELALVPKEMAKDFPIWRKDGGKIVEYFTPALADVLRAESVLETYLAGQPKQRRPAPLSKRYRGYKRDWVGFVAGGKRKLFASFFCSTFDYDWTRTPIFVKDGGDCFFNVTFDLESLTYESFAANGDG